MCTLRALIVESLNTSGWCSIGQACQYSLKRFEQYRDWTLRDIRTCLYTLLLA